MAAQKSGVIDEVWVTSEDPRILDVAVRFGAKTIDRPVDLAQALTNHGDVILHASSEITKLGVEFETLTILLGNTVMTRPSDIRLTLKALEGNPNASGAMTVWVAQDDHPYRAMVQGEDGFLQTFLNLPEQADTNRQSYPEVLYYDQGPWVVLRKTLELATRGVGPASWWWMGEKVLPIRRTWVTGRDTHTQFDLDVSEWWLTGQHSEQLL
jgi:N-acylneuraminate cytidylyltransferase